MSNRTADLDLTGATEAFCARLSAEGRSPATIAAYRRDLALVARVADELAPGIICRAITAGLLDQVFSAEAVTESKRGPRSAASLHRMKAAVRAFFAWAPRLAWSMTIRPGPSACIGCRESCRCS